MNKVSSVIDCGGDETDTLMLMTSCGIIISNDTIVLTGERSVDWTLGSYLCKRHLSAEKLILGIAIVEDESVHCKLPKKRKLEPSKVISVGKCIPKEANDEDVIKGLYLLLI